MREFGNGAEGFRGGLVVRRFDVIRKDCNK